MTIKAQSGVGKIRLFEDFTGVWSAVAETTDFLMLGDFFAGGEGFEDNDAGVIPSSTAPLSGSVTMTSGNTDADTSFIGTQLMFDVALMGPLVMETRLQIPDLDTKEIFVGFNSVLAFDHQLADSIVGVGATSCSFVGDGVGFYLSDELTASATHWHAVYNKTGAAKTITVADVTLGVGPTAGEWQILRIEIDPDGTSRFIVDGVLELTVAEAASTTTNLAAAVAFAANTTQLVVGDIDYILVEANRDWNA